MIEYRDLFEAPFLDGGRDPQKGLDCWGMVMEVMRRHGKNVPDFQISCFNSAAIAAQFGREAASGNWEPCEAEPGALVVMKLDPRMKGMAQHYGVCIDSKRFLHIVEKAWMLVTRTDHHYFGPRILGYWRWTK